MILAALILAPGAAHSCCNVIPGAARSFRGALALVNRPFAGPGEAIEMSVGSPCHTASRGFSPTAADNVVTVVFGGPGQPRHVVVITDDPGGLDLAGCASRPGVASVTPVSATGAGLGLSDGRLVFTLPDTDALLDPDGDDVTFSGPATLAVTRRDLPGGLELPCDLATARCTGVIGPIRRELVACADDLFPTDGTCETGALDTTFPAFTALPQPVDYQVACVEGMPPCQLAADTIRLAVDAGGNLLLPVTYDGVVPSIDPPVARLLEAFAAVPLGLPTAGKGFVDLYSPEGFLLEPVLSVLGTLPNATGIFGSVDAPYGVIRVGTRRGRCVGGTSDGDPCNRDVDCSGGGTCPLACAGGANDGQLCTMAADCPGGTCGELFDLSALTFMSTGPVVLPRLGPGFCEELLTQTCNADPVCGANAPCVTYHLEAGAACDLGGLLRSEDVLAFTCSEQEAGDLNDDPDTNDTVVTLRPAATGVLQPIPNLACTGPDAAGRAVTVGQFPAVVVDGPVVSFLESEAGQDACDENSDGDTTDSIFRSFALGPVELTSGTNHAADPAPLVNGRPLAASSGRVFFRASEAAGNVDLTGDGDMDDTVLGVLDVDGPSISFVCPAADVSVSAAMAAFLRPEGAGPLPDLALLCPNAAGFSLNAADADVTDTVVHLWLGSSAVNLGRAATAVALSPVGTCEPIFSEDLRILPRLVLASKCFADADCPVGDFCQPTWLAALVSEAGEGGTDANGDEDTSDNVVQLHAVGDVPGTWQNTGRAATAVRISGTLAAFTTSEAAQDEGSLNPPDIDSLDNVLELYDASLPSLGSLRSYGPPQAATDFVLGNPEQIDCGSGPVELQIVAFRTSEAAQGQNLNGDGNDDDVMQVVVYDVASGGATRINTGMAMRICDLAQCRAPYRVSGRIVKFLTPECAQGAGDRLTSVGCPTVGNDFSGDGSADDLVVQLFDICTGKVITAGAVDEQSGRDPLGNGGTVSPAGRCVTETACATSDDCGLGEFCDRASLRCALRQPGTCRNDDDCPAGTTCAPSSVATASADQDEDGIPDEVDGCPSTAGGQDDTDGDGVGNACDLQTCGNGVRELAEACDGADAADCPGRCQSDCACPTDHFQCYEVKPPGAFDRAGVEVVDRFGTTTVDLHRARAVCAPASKNGEDPAALAATDYLASYGVVRPSGIVRQRDLEVTNQFGTTRLDAVRPARLLVPSASVPGGSPSPGLDHFQCYKVKRTRGAGRFERVGGVSVETTFDTATVDVVRPLRLCVPAAKNGESPGAEAHRGALLCYRTRASGGLPPTAVDVENQFGAQHYVLGQRRELCVPSSLR